MTTSPVQAIRPVQVPVPRDGSIDLDPRVAHPPIIAGDPRNRRTIQRLRRLAQRVALLDVLAIAVSVAASWPLRAIVPGLDSADPAAVSRGVAALPWVVVLWVGLLWINRAYSRRVVGAGPDEYRAVLMATGVAGIAVSAICYYSGFELARGLIVCTFALGAILLVVERYALRRWVGRQRARGDLRQRVVVVGSRAGTTHLVRTLKANQGMGYDAVACVLTEPRPAGHILDVPATAARGAEELVAMCDAGTVDALMVAGASHDELRDIGWALEGRDIDLIVVPHMADVSGPRIAMRPVAGLPLLHVEEPQAGKSARWPKRVFDVIGAGMVCLLAAPLMLVVALWVKLEDGGPVIYRQLRVGLNGEPFACLKFRSMRVDADAMEARLRVETGHEGAFFKLPSDPRVTRIGSFIRRFSIDELPQLFNVMRGSMSLVGPRPQQQWEVDLYNDVMRRRLHVRPGMTGLWQVSGRSNLSWEDAVRLDLYYRDNWSMASDLLIMFKTIRAVIARDGAY